MFHEAGNVGLGTTGPLGNFGLSGVQGSNGTSITASSTYYNAADINK